MTIDGVMTLGIDFFFDILRWCFNLLTDIEIFSIPILYYFLGIIIMYVVSQLLINSNGVVHIPSSSKGKSKSQK